MASTAPANAVSSSPSGARVTGGVVSDRQSRSWWVVLRIAGIVIGIAALLRLATDTGVVEYNVLFQAWMDGLRGILELGYLIDLLEFSIVQPFLAWLRNLGLDVPPLQSHWQSIWVLVWLVLGATSRHILSGGGTAIKFGVVLFAAVCALISAVLAGIVQPGQVGSNFSIMFSAITGFTLFTAFYLIYYGSQENIQFDAWNFSMFAILFIVLILSILVSIGLLKINTGPNDVSLTIFILAFYGILWGAILVIIYSLVVFIAEYITSLRKDISRIKLFTAKFNTAIDIVAIMLSAFGISYFAAI